MTTTRRARETSRSASDLTGDGSSPRPIAVEVLRSTRVSPSFRRVTVGGPALAAFRPQGADQWFRLFIPASGRSQLDLPRSDVDHWYAEWLAMPADVQPTCRNYTVRQFRPASGGAGAELDIDFVIHRNSAGTVEGAAARWAEAAGPGDPVGLLDQGRMFEPHVGHRGVWLIADETGLPGIEGILAGLPDGASGQVVLEVADPDDTRPLTRPSGVTLTWVVRCGGAGRTRVAGEAALEVVRSLERPDPRCYVLAVGESGMVTGVRRHLVAAGHPKKHITFSGFWKLGT